jgi:hypothetical protein
MLANARMLCPLELAVAVKFFAIASFLPPVPPYASGERA